MSQQSRDAALRRIETSLDRLVMAVRNLEPLARQQHTETVSREAHDALLAAHQLLRTRAEAAVAGIDRLLNGETR